MACFALQNTHTTRLSLFTVLFGGFVRRHHEEDMRPEELYTFPRTRNSAVTCLAFGKDRKENFPDYFFCHGCDLLEDAVWSGNTRANRNQAKYVCTGGHEGNRIHPT